MNSHESERRGKHGFFQEALYQGTASAVPKDREKGLGFSPCGLWRHGKRLLDADFASGLIASIASATRGRFTVPIGYGAIAHQPQPPFQPQTRHRGVSVHRHRENPSLIASKQ